ncbi:MAG: hypothetical protein GTO18_13205 [Anaerolineales bacterium]|nr:hypothetical protein [Anaerolineales bacterium]
MSNKNNEVERYRRIRDQQLQARDPKKHDRKLQKNISRRYRETREPFSFGAIFREVPGKWMGLLVGAFVGFVIFIILPYFVEHELVDIIGVAVLLFIAIVGLAVGQAVDAKRDLEDLIK